VAVRALFLLDIIIFRQGYDIAAHEKLVTIRGLQLSGVCQLPQQSMHVVEARLPVNSLNGGVCLRQLDGLRVLLRVRHDRLLRVELSRTQQSVSAASGQARLQKLALRTRLDRLLRPSHFEGDLGL
jgi:hypothetical protein